MQKNRFIRQRLIQISTLIGLCYGCQSFATELCTLNKTTQAEDQWSFGNLTLHCSDTDKIGNWPKNELLVIRGHEKEVNRLPVERLHHAHGYHLVRTKSDLSAFKHSNHDHNSEHHHHLDFIPLNQFTGLQNHILSPEHKIGTADTNITALLNQVDANRWLTDIQTLAGWSRQTGSAGNVSAADWIALQMTQLGLSVTLPEFQVNGVNTKNIMGIKTGQTRPNDWYVIGAHMDSIPSTGSAPGAVDNASGCAAVLELARITSIYNFAGSLIFMCYSGEEQGLYGSEFHADTLVNNGNQNKIKAALTMDMIGYTSNSEHELLIESASTYQNLMNQMVQLANTYVPNLTVTTSTNYFGSDHVSYIDNGMPGILSIDDDWNAYPHYHQSTDTDQNINSTQGQYIIQVNLATLATLAGLTIDDDLIFTNGFELAGF